MNVLDYLDKVRATVKYAIVRKLVPSYLKTVERVIQEEMITVGQLLDDKKVEKLVVDIAVVVKNNEDAVVSIMNHWSLLKERLMGIAALADQEWEGYGNELKELWK
jgi:hypothetical protein